MRWRGTPSRLTADQMAAVIEELSPWWGEMSPLAVAHFVQRVIRVLTPPSDPEPGEAAAHEARSLSFALTADSVILSGNLPRLEGEAVIAAIDAFAERLRSEADHVPASARRADALVALANAAHASGSIPSRGGLPVSVSVTLDSTSLGDQLWTTSRGHALTDAEQRFVACDAMVTPIVLDSGHCPDTVAELLAAAGPSGGGSADVVTDAATDAASVQAGTPLSPSAAARIAELAMILLGTRIPLAVGRTARTATPAQRRALAARDRGCIIPGCGIPAEACQTHHVDGLGRRREHRPPQSGPALLGTSPPGRPGDVDHRADGDRRSGTPTRTRGPTRNPLACEQRSTVDHREDAPNTLAAVRALALYRTTTFTRFDHFDQPLEFLTRTAE